MVRQSPLKHFKATTTSMKASMARSLFPSRCRPHLTIALTSRMGNLSRLQREGIAFWTRVWNGAQNQGRGDAVATSSGLKPKKVWAKKRFVDTKADKAKKRASSKFK